jgi:NADPH-ferrihemoprotein reductase
MWPVFAKHMGIPGETHQAMFTPSFEVAKCHDLLTDSPGVYLGEPNERYLEAEPRDMLGPFDAHHPYFAPVTESRLLVAPSATSRNCIHVEVSLAGSSLVYETGDHAAVWPSNPTEEVEKILRVLSLEETSQTVIKLTSVDPLVHVPFPSPTIYEAIMRYYLEIAGPIPRQTISDITPFAPNEKAQQSLSRLTADKDLFHAGTHFSTLSRFLEKVGGAGIEWTQIPFSLLVESLPKLQPRFYSISSSSLAQREKISLTVAVESTAVPGRENNDPFCGIASNYLMAVGQTQKDELASQHPRYENGRPREKLLENSQVRVPIHIRHSNFKLPKDPTAPVIMIGPGTGVAPFRGFVQERAKQVSDGTPIESMLLFFGCRKHSEDFLYEREWEVSSL